MKSDKEKYEFNLKRFSNHRRAFPLSLVLRILVGVVMVGLVYFLSNQILELNKKKQKEKTGFELKIEENQ